MAPHPDPSGPAGPGGDTVTERTPAPEQEQSAARRANPANRAADFGIDTTARTTREAITAYLRGLRGGDLGSLPALLGLAALFVLFSVLDSGGTFPSLLNLANLLQQGAGPTIIAMGLVFVLLTGEIDLAAGTASGLAAALMALHLMSDGNVLGATGTTVFVLLVAVMLAGAVLAALVRVWAGSVISLLTAVVLVIGVPANAFTVMGLAVGVGVVIGCLTGFLVARIGMPSFVVTLALFITWQGVILQLIGDGGTIALRDPLINAVANGNLSVTASWVLFVVVAGGYALVQTVRLRTRLRSGLVAPPTGLVALKIGAVVVLGGLVTFALVQDRSPGVIAIAGVPYVVPIVLVLLVLGTWVLDRTRFGRHVYAVGGNREAARRAGIDVARIRASVFVISTAFAAIGAIVYSSKIGSVNPAAGGGNTLLFAVGAAVIGGTSLFGGRGRISNAVIGGTVLATVQNGLGLLKQPAAVVFVVTGLVLLLAAGVDVASRRRAAATGR
ncbi:Xylose ABC transporter, permease protein XylH [Pseudonocardia sp. Ae406_Ps2]|uniref:sugar ABC transporter permease n=1 Tax=unclassified Pseudonocardia TaxID=2619320 RepID=UPI0009628DF8|nr:Xylose ABC transporter, permease protein XylH [Pseudonocardia sp. Ae406_Ps2]OLM07880.1 Xylose ABC transporter, permease protein XylH [Pseudonocardia sp. Ae331_Ps2]OLM13870.1 Xylose ABC transporter, permease protein XylH [Pseudonocardia sp. Ae505_Ps2]OLM21898.1 Xylose ABC transporter, permease protein XylH [Pseudonocardia sp. Ae706_Ps2]OLM30986.1 Xylose ABC transporter, permease protein XylH [Pseudonocardia sp. Ae717_Ps2]